MSSQLRDGDHRPVAGRDFLENMLRTERREKGLREFFVSIPTRLCRGAALTPKQRHVFERMALKFGTTTAALTAEARAAANPTATGEEWFNRALDVSTKAKLAELIAGVAGDSRYDQKALADLGAGRITLNEWRALIARDGTLDRIKDEMTPETRRAIAGWLR